MNSNLTYRITYLDVALVIILLYRFWSKKSWKICIRKDLASSDGATWDIESTPHLYLLIIEYFII